MVKTLHERIDEILAERLVLFDYERRDIADLVVSGVIEWLGEVAAKGSQSDVT